MADLYNECVALLKQRGVTLDDIVECVVYLQEQYVPNIHEINVHEYVESVMRKREVQHALLTGINIDIQVDNKAFGSDSINNIIATDMGLYGIDEVLAYGICNLYGSIALTNYGYIDKVKPGIIGVLNDHNQGQCNTFIDDIVGAIAAAAASKLAHSNV